MCTLSGCALSKSKTGLHKEDIQEGITRMDLSREMLIGIWDHPKMTEMHQIVFINYFSEVTSKATNKSVIAPRTFSIELLTNGNDARVAIRGPISDLRGYSCKDFYVINATMNQLIDIGKETINAHGEYKHYTNNCRHFAKNFLRNVRQVIQSTPKSVSSKLLIKWLREHDTASESYQAELEDAEVPTKSFNKKKKTGVVKKHRVSITRFDLETAVPFVVKAKSIATMSFAAKK